jgi:hypothetical protein
MTMDVLVWRMNRRLVELLSVDVKNLRLVLVNPHRHLIHGGLSTTETGECSSIVVRY